MHWFRTILIMSAIVMVTAESYGQATQLQPSAPTKPDAVSSEPIHARSMEHIAQQGLRPLSRELPDTKVLPGLLPPDASKGLIGGHSEPAAEDRGADWQPITYTWMASNLRHRPLYFEDATLERYGQSYHPLVQPAASGVRFFLTFPMLPYAMVVNPPRPAISTLGYFRPGSSGPCLLQRPPLQADAGLAEAGAWIGLIFLIP